METSSAQATAKVGERDLDVVVIGFADKISVNVHVDGKVGKMYYVPLTASSVAHLTTQAELEKDYTEEIDLLPLPHLTPMSLLGGSSDEDVKGRLYAGMIASLVSRQAPHEQRTIVIGLSPQVTRMTEDITSEDRKLLSETIRLVQNCRVW